MQHCNGKPPFDPDGQQERTATLPQRLMVWLLRAYQRLLSPLMGGDCRFHPSCSHYAIDAITRHGCLRGFVLTLWRLLRCNPLFKGGNDPVPDTTLSSK